MIPLEGPSQSKFLDVLLPFDLSRKNVAHVAYDILLHKVSLTRVGGAGGWSWLLYPALQHDLNKLQL